MNNKKLHKFIDEIITKSKQNGLTSEQINDKLDTVIELLIIEKQEKNACQIVLLKKYISRILSDELKLSEVFKIISGELDLLDVTCEISPEVSKKNDEIVIDRHNRRQYTLSHKCGEISYRCNSLSSNDRCGSSSSSDRCGSSSSAESCGSSRGSSRC